MPCSVEVIRHVPLFSLFDEEELAVLASEVELHEYAARQRIYRIGEPSDRAYILVSGAVEVTIIDEGGQVVVLDVPIQGDVFGFASMLDQTPHQTDATAIEPTQCIVMDLHDLTVLLRRKPDAGLDLMKVMGKQFHAAERLVRLRAARNPNDVIEEAQTLGEKVADTVASFGGSWTFITLFAVGMAVYAAINVELGSRAWDPYPFILLNLFLSMLAAIQAPIIMMSQNRQDKKDRLRSELDYDVNRSARNEIQGLAHRMGQIYDKVDDLEEMLRNKK
jgi:CRP/FNR family cyclic AMP-dependent transcriptional regulator